MDHAFMVLNMTTARLWYLLENIQFGCVRFRPAKVGDTASALFSNFLTLWAHIMRGMKLGTDGINPVQETKFTVVG